ncbi:MAG: chitobiase/beta-hexosaminidase C-terminal domain-containing protein [Candidatus Cloacimonadota bacterium]
MKKCLLLILLSLVALFILSCDQNSTSPEDEPIGELEITPPGGSYDETLNIFIHCPTYGATIRYTTDGTNPTKDSQVYYGELQINTNTVLKARAFKAGYLSSPIATETYVFGATAVQPVVITPDGGVFAGPHSVTLTCATPGAEIRYTLDGTNPTQSSNLYNAPFLVSGTVTVKAKAFKEGLLPSVVSSVSYNMQLEPPIFSLPAGQYPTPQSVSITHSNPIAEIRYTIDGSDPTESSAVYTQAIPINGNTMLKARAYLANWEASEVVSASYIISLAEQVQLIPAGSFHNGTANVSLSAFYISRREVTELEWDYIMLDMEEIVPDRPVSSVSWVKAIQYCNYRSMVEGFTPCYSYSTFGTVPAEWPEGWEADHTQLRCDWDATGYRLPTEMEWMYAARGGHLSHGYTYSGSNNIDEVAWHSGNCTEPGNTGLKEPNELGLHDMSGNMWEFCWDIYHNEYPPTDSTDPNGPATGYYRVLRGGSFSTDASNCTVTRRFYAPPNLMSNSHGIRVVRKF